MFQGAGNGDEDADSGDDSSYWNQYDQFTATTLGSGLEPESLGQISTPKEIMPRMGDPSSYYDQYDNVETAITSNGGEDFGKPVGTASNLTSGMSGPTENKFLNEIGMEEYVRNTIRNLSQLALRCGMSEKRLRQLITEEMN